MACSSEHTVMFMTRKFVVYRLQVTENIVRIVGCGTVQSFGHVAQIGETRNAQRILVNAAWKSE
jgi:hypothetical protein